jgi:peptidoglycan lytic transglycosylase
VSSRCSAFVVALFLFLGSAVAAFPQTASTSDSDSHKAGHKTHSSKSRSKKRPLTAAERKKRERDLLRSHRLTRAFVASASLKPMAKQLLDNRTKAAYAGVQSYATRHAGDDAGMMANLVLGYAHILDRDYPAAISPLKKAALHPGELGDYVAYFLAMAYGAGGDEQHVIETLRGFETKYPDSIFTRDAVVIYANALLAAGSPQDAITALSKYESAHRSDVELALGRAYLRAGQTEKGTGILRQLYYQQPLATEADSAAVELLATNALTGTTQQVKERADQLLQARRYSDALREYRLLMDQSLTPEERNSISVSIGVAQYRSGDRRGARDYLQSLSIPPGEANAQRLATLADIARADDDENRFVDTLAQLRQGNPNSPYLEQQLFAAGNMYLLKRDYDRAIDSYREVSERFPSGRYGHSAHWKAVWLTWRQGRTVEAAKGFEEQLSMYPDSPEVPAALYWRARLAEEQNDVARAAAYYQKLTDRFRNYYYADRARDRLESIGTVQAISDPLLDRVPPVNVVARQLITAPTDDLRFQKARLLENAAMYDFAVRELQQASSDGGDEWAANEIGRLYQDSGGYQQAIEYIKKTVPAYWSMDYGTLPRPYWEYLFPRPYWTDLRKFSLLNGLDPFLVASLIRQESEFNSGAISHANAVGLMQLLPGTGKTVARELRIRGYRSTQLLVPTTNLQLGTRYFKDLVDRYNGRFEYALAAYNAGTDRVDSWLADGKYRDAQEFVESIPFTETREYVQAILRNVSLYRRIYSEPTQERVAINHASN